MKQAKVFSLLAVLLVAAMLLSSCGLFGAGEIKLKKLLNDDATVEAFPVPTVATELPDFTDMTLDESDGALYHFTRVSGSNTLHKVLNLETGNTVLSLEGSRMLTYAVSLGTVTYGNSIWNTEGYIWVLKSETINGLIYKTTYLYDELGTLVAEISGEVTASAYEGLLKFGNAFYRVSENSIKKIRDLSPLAKHPEPEVQIGDRYYEIEELNDGVRVTVYDEMLDPVSTYKTPASAKDPVYTVLGNGDLLLQYLLYLPEGSEDYTALLEDGGELLPVELVTVIVNSKNGKAKEIDCDYYLMLMSYLPEDEVTELGLNADRVSGYAHGVKIENGRIPEADLDDCCLLFIDSDGDLYSVKDFMGAHVNSVILWANDRFGVGTEDGRCYLVDGEGELIGEATNATPLGNRYLVCDGKIYGTDLRVLLDYKVGGFTLEYTIEGDGILYFKNERGELFTWNGSGEPTAVKKGDDAVRNYTVYLWGYAVTDYENDQIVLYNVNGTDLLTLDTVYPGIAPLGFSDAAFLISASVDGHTVYYRIAK